MVLSVRDASSTRIQQLTREIKRVEQEIEWAEEALDRQGWPEIASHIFSLDGELCDLKGQLLDETGQL